LKSNEVQYAQTSHVKLGQNGEVSFLIKLDEPPVSGGAGFEILSPQGLL
jgi:hypothetical protein